jgi:DMSO/TMAO reductase YedYZ molybdopterin-dependent catalytic subunit
MHPVPKNLTRRQFVRVVLGGVATTLVGAACKSQTAPQPTAVTPQALNTAEPLLATEVVAMASATPGSVATAPPVFPPLPVDRPTTLRNRNDPHYNVRYFKSFPPVDHEAWRLQVTGLIESPGSFSLADLLAWPAMEQVSRMKCVECWSFKAKWGGFHYASLAERVKPLPEATHVRLDCADGYWEIVPLEELADPRVVFVLKMNDELLLDEYGAPLRMMFPAKYGYKSAKAVTTIAFTDQPGSGYWSTVGPYTIDGQIEPGYDHPQDLSSERKQITGGEITSY